MTDRELLELAAKACGYKEVSASYHSDDDGYTTSEFWYLHVKDLYDGKSGDSCAWNPLTDDGDALRLAVKLKIDYLYYMETNRDLIEAYKIDPYATTRLTIVRAAAEIGRNMK